MAGGLLYVGMTVSPATRFKSHGLTKDWWLDVVRIEIDWCANRAEAAKAEARAILTENPRYNVARPGDGGKSVIGSGRPAWMPKTNEHRRLIADAIGAVEAWKKAEAEMFAAFDTARAGGVSLNYLFGEVGAEPSPATVYRRIGRSGAPSPEPAAVSLQPESETAP